MRLIKLDGCTTGTRIGKSIYRDNGRVLLSKGTYLTDSLIEKLKKFNVYTIYIEDDMSEGIEIVDAIPEELRVEAASIITSGLDDIAGLNSHKSKLEKMVKSSRAVRSMQKIFKDILSCLNENRTALNLLATTKVHENHVYTHSLNVTIYACQLAIENGLPLKNIEEIGLGAMLHDIGKIYIPNEILNKPGKLTDEEYEQIKSHCELGFNHLKKIHEIPLTVSHCALQHHERIDGTGYPRGLKSNEIHKYAKIISVADVFDDVTSHREYRKPVLPHKGIEILYSGNGTQFDSKQIHMFKNSIAIYPPGLTVKLNDGRTGIVSKYNFNAVGRPEIRIIKGEENQEVSPYEIDLAANEHLTVEIVEADALL
ncbi:HD-GYP domain-containing protein [Cytobacillus dafuensis]|uniref:HD-GYP domain-containing protein n=1 Tax=Cytobacillus dafuensis TaxID=1742359 RepID=A0A5B8Z5D8_CYTDA|nr:HD-GYP domain-containing protein [Cytobacillus dafuensis]QED48128.1 HD-GYP domain-containing protein [Cytobacillus dafuensis]